MKRRITLLLAAAALVLTGCAVPFVLDGKSVKIRKTWVAFSNKNTTPLEYLIFVPPTIGFKTGFWVYVEAPTLVREASSKNNGVSVDALMNMYADLQEEVNDLRAERSDSVFSAESDSIRAQVRELQKKLRAERAKGLARGNGGPLEVEVTTAVECPVGWVTFSYWILESSRPKGYMKYFTFFVKPIEEGKARVINLVGEDL